MVQRFKKVLRYNLTALAVVYVLSENFSVKHKLVWLMEQLV